MCVVPEATEPQSPAWPEIVDDMQVAEALGTSVARVRAMVRKGELPKPLVDGRRWKWAKARVVGHLTGEIPASPAS